MPSRLANAIVFVSYFGAGLGDMGTTSIAPNQPRVVLALYRLVNDLIQRAWLWRTPRWLDALAILGLILLGALAALFRGTLSSLLIWLSVSRSAALERGGDSQVFGGFRG